MPTLSSLERLESQPELGSATSRSLSPSPRGTSAGRSIVAPSRVDGDVRLTGIRVRRIRYVREGARKETRRPVYSGRKAASWVCCVLFVFVLCRCGFATELMYVYLCS